MRPLHLPLLVKVRHACSFVSSEESNWVQSARIESLVRSTTAAVVRDLVADCAGRRACGGAGDWVRLSRS